MLTAKARALSIKWHAYLSCFFLPVALLYTLTGALYLLGFEGNIHEETEFELDSRPVSEQQEDLVAWLTPVIRERAARAMPDIYYREGKIHGWYNMRGGVRVDIPEDIAEPANVEVNNYDLWLQLVLIHKGVAGQIFVVLGILLGISLLFSLISGVLVALSIPKYKTASLYSIGFGSLVLVAAYWMT